MLAALVIGFVASFFGSIPIAGPISVAVLSLAFERRGRSAMLLAFGAAVAESLWAFLAFWGFATVLEKVPRLVPIARLAGCIMLVALGSYLAVRRPEEHQPRDETGSPSRSVAFGFFATIANPTLLVTWTAVASAAQASGLLRGNSRDAPAFAIGVCGGTITWFVTLLAIVRTLHRRMRPETTRTIVSAMGVAVALLGLAFFARTLILWPT